MSSLLTRRKAPSASSTDIPDLASLKIRPRVGIAQWASIALGIYVGLSLLQFLVFNQNWKWDVIFSYLFSQVVINGLLNTIYLTLLTTVCGLILGVIAAWARMSPLVVLRTIAILYIWMMRAMPPLVMLLFVFFFGALAPTLGIGIPFGPTFAEVPANEIISRFSAAIIGLSIYLGAYSAEIFRGGILSLPTGQFEACKSLGLPPFRAYQKILGPQLIRVIIPSLANDVITIFKSTSLVSVIGYTELLTTVQTIYARNFETIPLLMVAVIWYLVLTSIAMFGQSRLEKRFARGFARRTQSTPKNALQEAAAKEDF
ncbi:amino acid ABC transporter permease [Arthrobacter sp. TES]|jgi:polar amino acid transport system permease protein|uniref:amino acid ABC transporter permease n=1 Tax=Paenarthrobacter ureafaciens TaxID=37931 RepID=UPI0003F98BA7|nr:amino acid ABC transporter permease [Paenarthrobacter ureafaciens]QOI63190.1 amino acid ABC transporter permease [Arthrobacter sp. TES]GLU60409.1 polar amino acid ABC transporter permease [Paenarthrobacter ureafaciens]GLU64519.1 polar amino acid ABC transporter permease [Paenarthrobacter ureafaciens]GLU68798.1 polar amino acid ABC transporter permease [Paenarthrobacter ureafaciens]GLU73216.1 polar amino acid ABC transporter permease [Paenarthrobacter ureafaciens]